MKATRTVALTFLASAALYAQADPPARGLTLERLAFHQYEDGPELPAGYEFLPGETVWFSCRISGFRVERKSDEQRVKLTWKMSVLDPLGVLADKPHAGAIEDRLLPEDKEWRPKFLVSFQLPGFAIGGAFKIPVVVKDEFAGIEVAKILELRVKGPDAPTATTLSVRNLRFLRNEDDSTPMRDAVYRPGTTLWAKFEIVGYKLGDNNRFDVNYGLAVQNSEGKELFAQPDAAGDAKESFYPQRWVPGTLSLTLNQGVAVANYILMVTVKDKLAGTTAEAREPFRVQ